MKSLRPYIKVYSPNFVTKFICLVNYIMLYSEVMISSDLASRVHRHQLIKNEDYHAREGDLCYGCGLLLHESSSIYHCTYFGTNAEEDDCAHVLIHKTCAHLPTKLEHPSHKHELKLSERPLSSPISRDKCDVCGITLKWFTYYCDFYKCEFQICLACIIPFNKITIHPPYHPHKLTFLANLATFRCDGCHEVDTDFSYMCYTCPFWIHLKCSNLPPLLACDIHHKHPLRLTYSLPENYRRFQQSCRICRQYLRDPRDWLYHCPDCRFFAHIKCATSPPKSHGDTKYANQDYSIHKSLSGLVQLPLPEHESLLRHCIKGSTLWPKDAALTPPDQINHWSHEHKLLLKNPTVASTTSEEEIWPICNGCTESITIKDGAFYECGECDYILHGYCAHFPQEMSDRAGYRRKIVAIQPRVHDIWSCARCKGFRNGTQMRYTYEGDYAQKSTIERNFDSACVILPERIVHKAHQHKSRPNFFFRASAGENTTCSACNQTLDGFDICYACNGFECFRCIHIECALKPLRVTHRWDPHPLHLITSAEEVIDHPHEFQCEFCSEEIDPNYWFYHCSICDLSFHFKGCIDPFPYSKVKFGATNIMLDAHQHGLTFVLNKKKHQPCHRCHKDTFGRPVLVCIPCNFVQHSQPELCT
ncbi:uncharacterized protein LOC108207120 [Daucus carota subsp. sativus]|uniref:uncharacterized protein LOC108207120 n=1 Tax=Daucus carota subsp. sativus TaxID=79200 RepID=UPI003083DC3B